MNTKPTRSELRVLQLVASTRGKVNFYILHRRLFLSPAEIGIVVSNLVDLGYVKTTDTGIELTEKGFKYIYSSRTMIADSTEKVWLTVPGEFTTQRIDPYQPFAPSYTKFLEGRTRQKKVV
ncbi:hypothetical protein [Paraburkholderia caffeinilytica]|uniref:hypothetical protein n=1 Tax=Paraburkholderia caffeinilytica TaxID=1761016 RepID=UPI003DA09B3F